MDTILVIDNDEATRIWLQQLLSENNFKVIFADNGEDGILKVLESKPNLIIIDINLPDIHGENVINQILHTKGKDGLPIIVFTSSYNEDIISQLFELGIADFVQKTPGVEKELLGKCSTSLLRAKSSTGQLHNGKIITFFSAKGGIGTSTLCLNLAHSIAKLVAEQSVVVVDLVLPLGSLAIMVGVDVRKSIAGLSNESYSPNFENFQDYLKPVDDWNFSLLPGSCSPHDGQNLNPSRISPIVRTLQSEFDYVIIDIGKTLSKISIPILEISDALSIVISPDLVTAELTQIALEYINEIGVRKEKLFLFLNRAVGLEGLAKSEIEERIENPIQRTVPYARDNFTFATNHKVPFAVQFPNESLTMELSSLASKLLDFVAH